MSIEITPNTWFIVARAVHFGACMLTLGIFVFDRVVIAHAARHAPAFIDRRWPPIARLLLFIALPLALLSGIAWFLINAMLMADLPAQEAWQADNLRIMWDTTFGRLWDFRGYCWLFTALAAIPALCLRRRSLLQIIAAYAALLFSAVLAISLARAGHGGEFSRWHQIFDAGHLVIGAAWPIGLLPLALLLWKLRREPATDRPAALLPLIRRFSTMSIVSVLLLIATGIGNSWTLFPTLRSLITSTYGITLLVKAGLFAVMVMIGAINRLYLQPRLTPWPERPADAPAPHPNPSHSSQTMAVMEQPQTVQAAPAKSTSLRRLQINIWLEILLGLGVITAVGMLGTLEPPTPECCAVSP